MIKLLDFTLEKYKKLINTMSDSDYKVLTVSEYLSSDLNSMDKFIILRHDVDISSDYQLEFAKYESSKGINSTYYVRCVKGVINFSVLNQIKDLGHEIGYHYETLTKSNGNYDIALKTFKKE